MSTQGRDREDEGRRQDHLYHPISFKSFTHHFHGEIILLQHHFSFCKHVVCKLSWFDEEGFQEN